MLSLKRRTGQALLFILPDGRVIRVQVLESYGGASGATLGTVAPSDVKIVREELYRNDLALHSDKKA